MLNEYGMRLDRNGYARSVLQDDTCRCCKCGRRDRKLDRHEVFGGANRQKSKALGLWVVLCHEDCHEGTRGVHQDAELRQALRAQSQLIAQDVYGWGEAEFVRRFGRSYTEERSFDCAAFGCSAQDDSVEGAQDDGEELVSVGVFTVQEEAELPW